MSTQLNRRKYVGFGREVTRGTAVAPTQFALLKEPATMQIVNADVDEDGITGAFSGQLDKNIAMQHVEGDMSMELDPNNRALFEVLRLVMGAPTSVTTLGATTHTYNLNNSDTPMASLTTDNFGGAAKRIRGCHFSGFEMDVTDTESSFKTQFLGLQAEDTSTPTVAITSNSTKLFAKNFVCRIADTIAGLGAGTAVIIQKLNVKVDIGAKVQNALGQLPPDDIHAVKPSVEITFSGIIRNEDFYNLHLNNTHKAFVFEGVGNNYPNIGTSTLKPTMRLEIPPSAVRITFSRDKDDKVKFDATIQGEWDWTVLTHLRLTLINAIAS